MSETAPLRLLAEDERDLEIISAAIQDAIARAGDLAFDQRRRRFTIEVNRFRWEAASQSRRGGERVRAVLGFDGVLSARSRGVSKVDPEVILSLLSVAFEPGEEAPAGRLRLLFAGDGEIVLDVECIDATLFDSDRSWATRNRPDHERKAR